MTQLGEEYFEIGRGYEEISKNYSRPYILGVNIEDKEKPFVIAQGAMHSDSFAIKLTLIELISDKWLTILEKANCLDFRKKIEIESKNGKKHPLKFLKKVKNEIKIIGELNGNWVSKQIIEVLDYKYNFSNWIDATGTPGYFRFELDINNSKESKNCHVRIPTIDVYKNKGYFSIYYGRFEMKDNKILIWQNNTSPVKVKYKLTNGTLKMTLFGKKIEFERE